MKAENDYIFGTRAVIEALKSDREIDRILIARKSESSLSRELLNLVKELKVPVQYVPVEKINRFTRKNHQGALAFLSVVSYVPLEELVNLSYEKGEDPMFLMLDQVSDVRNFGAITRSAECLGFNGIIIPFKGAARINADAVKTSAGALLKMKISRVKSMTNTLKFLKDSGLRIVAVTEKGSKKCYDADLKGPLVIILGNEERGISDNLLRLSEEKVYIPMSGETESLNVSVAASVLMYEISRQKKSGN